MLNRSFPTNRGILNIDKERKENVTGNPHSNRGILNMNKEIIICWNQPIGGMLI